jgi:hypothetical protein
MRHFSSTTRQPAPIGRLPPGMVLTPSTRTLVTPPSLAEAPPPSLLAAPLRAVPLPVVTTRADVCHLVAVSAEVAATIEAQGRDSRAWTPSATTAKITSSGAQAPGRKRGTGVLPDTDRPPRVFSARFSPTKRHTSAPPARFARGDDADPRLAELRAQTARITRFSTAANTPRDPNPEYFAALSRLTAEAWRAS